MFGRKRKFENVDVEITEPSKRDERDKYDPYPEWCVEIRRENEKREIDALKRLQIPKGQYHEAARNLGEYEPDVTVKDYASGKFLCIGEIELPIAHIEGVELDSEGGEPYLDQCSTSLWCSYYAEARKGIKDFGSDMRNLPAERRYFVSENRAQLSICMTSGRRESVFCWRPQLEVFKARIEQAWKEGK